MNINPGSSPGSTGWLMGRWMSLTMVVLPLLLLGLEGCASPTRIEAPPVPDDFDISLYGIWQDVDGDCQNTREEVLIAKSWGGVTLTRSGCHVVDGTWLDSFTGQNLNDTRGLDVDHFIPLAEVHRSGGDVWSREKRFEYGNDLKHQETFVVVSLEVKLERAGMDPADWMPSNPAVQCAYIRTWVKIKEKWQLKMDAREQAVINWMMQKCGS